MEHIFFLMGVAAAAWFFALLEVQIEGERGWASGLPTWRVENRWTRRLLGARAVTGYHVHFQLLVATLVHLPYALSLAPFSWPVEARLLAFLIFFWILEDFLWFVMNPAFRLRGFRPERAWWHAENWWGFMPRDYWLFLPLGTALYVYSWS